MKRWSRMKMVLVTATVLPVLVALLVILPAGPSDAAARTVLTGSSPRWATLAVSTDVAATQRFSVSVYLQPRGGEAALQAAVAAVSTPGSSQYRHFLTTTGYRARFAPTEGAVRSVSAWLEGSGMTVTGVEAHNRFVAASGSTRAVQAAFGVVIRNYRYQGRIYRAPAQDASVPAGLRGDVLGVIGLDNGPHYATALHTSSDASPATTPSPSATRGPTPLPPPTGFRNARPCSQYYGQLVAKKEGDFSTPLPKWKGSYRDYVICGYTPAQLTSAYGTTTSGLTGAKVTIAIVDAYGSPTIASDADMYSTRHGVASFQPKQLNQSFPAKYRDEEICSGNGWFSEESLDVEAAHLMAPAASIRYYAAESCLDKDLLGALTRVVDDNKASIVTDSWGEPEEGETSGFVAAYDQVFQQGAMQGIGFLFSSGDDGDFGLQTGLAQPDYPASDPYVTAVGGTTTAIDANGNIEWQAGWGTHKYVLSANGSSWTPLSPSFIYGSGGGYSTLFNEPSYQMGVVPVGASTGRAVPDVAMDADVTTGMLIGLTQAFPTGAAYGEYRIGGTSVASPLMAGMQALATQSAHGRLGFANPAIYALAKKKVSTYFDDVTPLAAPDGNVRADYADGIDSSQGILYSIRTFDDDLGLRTTHGWDDVTGIGSPTPAYLTAFHHAS